MIALLVTPRFRPGDMVVSRFWPFPTVLETPFDYDQLDLLEGNGLREAIKAMSMTD
jgi:hypothetical protein